MHLHWAPGDDAANKTETPGSDSGAVIHKKALWHAACMAGEQTLIPDPKKWCST